MTLPDLRKRLRYWKKDLDLREYRIRLRLAKQDEMPSSHAELVSRGDHGQAVLTIRECEYAEYWLVHELLHLVLDGLVPCDNQAASFLEEKAINRLARALCRYHKVPCPGWNAIS